MENTRNVEERKYFEVEKQELVCKNLSTGGAYRRFSKEVAVRTSGAITPQGVC